MYMNNRRQMVEKRGHRSSEKQFICEVPQGTVLGAHEIGRYKTQNMDIGRSECGLLQIRIELDK